MPELGRLALTENTFPPEIVTSLEHLLAEMPFTPVRPLHDPGAPDVDDWAEFVNNQNGNNWLQIPWFFAETYFFRRILEATCYFQPGKFLGVDPYLNQKYQVLEISQPVIRTLCTQLNTMLQEHITKPLDYDQVKRNLTRLLVHNLWGNQADLSMWPAGKGERPDHQDITIQQEHILDDDSAEMIDYLFSLNRPARINFIIDNTGLELVNDLILADYLLSTQLASSIRFNLKVHPTYVSDALIWDVKQTIALLASDSHIGVQDLAKRLIHHLETDCLELVDHIFWTSPLSFWEMPVSLWEQLADSDLLISKGDVNYRRLLGDRDWSPTISVSEVLSYIPTPLLAIRVCKAEVVMGLSPKQVDLLNQTDLTWMFNGNWGVIQFSKGNIK